MKNSVNKQKVFDVLFVVAFVFYILLVIDSTLFKYDSLFNILTGNRFMPIRIINLVPFSAHNVDIYGQIKDCFINVLLFVPFGYMLQMKSKKNNIGITVLLIPFITSLLIEALQYILSLGFSDTTDLICNTAGGIAGAVAFILISKVFGSKINVLNFILFVLLALGCAFLVFMHMLGYALMI